MHLQKINLYRDIRITFLYKIFKNFNLANNFLSAFIEKKLKKKLKISHTDENLKVVKKCWKFYCVMKIFI